MGVLAASRKMPRHKSRYSRVGAAPSTISMRLSRRNALSSPHSFGFEGAGLRVGDGRGFRDQGKPRLTLVFAQRFPRQLAVAAGAEIELLRKLFRGDSREILALLFIRKVRLRQQQGIGLIGSATTRRADADRECAGRPAGRSGK